MDIFSVLTMVGGLAMFLYGMDAMGDGLSKLSGGKLESILEKLTSNRLMAVLLGAGVTAVIQSSSATTVMVVGFVNSGIMKLSQAVGIIMGANIGTTMTSWLLSLVEVEGTNFFMQMLKPTSFSPLLALIGIIMIMTAKDDGAKKKDVGTILMGFAILMFGMDTMSGAVKPLANDPNFTGILTMFSNPILGVIAGAVLTAVIQSSSASVGILQALCATGAMNFGSALPIIMGQNIGTCITAVMSGMGASKNAKRASMIHLYFNLIGTIVFLVVFYIINAFVHFEFLNGPASATGIALVHSIFNVTCTVCWFPFANVLVKLAELTIRDKEDGTKEVPSILDERFLEQPAFAMELCRKEAVKMAELAKEAIYIALDNVGKYRDEDYKRVLDIEVQVDKYEDALGSYLVKLNNKDLSPRDSRSVSVILHCINDFERISDHAVNIMESAKEMHDKKLSFSVNATKEFEIFVAAAHKIVHMAVHAYADNDLENAKMVEPLEQVINGMNAEMKQRHIRRLRKGKCTIELGWVLQDLLTSIERVSDHCSNIAICIIEVTEDEFDTHNYLEELKENNFKWYKHAIIVYGDKFKLPDTIVDEEETVVSIVKKEEKDTKKK
jgi:phosphate:Na+ symporter